MRFKLDENLPIEAAALLSASGHDALTVMEQHLSGASDALVMAHCDREARVLVTLDLDFADIRAYPAADHAGIVVLRLPRSDRESILRALSRVQSLLDTETPSGQLWIVEADRVRIRDNGD